VKENNEMVTMTTLEKLVPRRLKMGYEEYLKTADDSKIMEWIDGEVIIYMPPTREHQNLVLFLSELLNSFIQFFNLGTVIVVPFEVKLWSTGPAREPDIIFVANENFSKLTPERFEGGPDLLIEIVSPGSVTEDRVHKFTQYEQARVREYWIVDPRPHQQQVDFYILGEDNLYYPAPPEDDGRYYAAAIPNFWLDLEWLWRETLPNPQLALAEIMIFVEGLSAEVKETYQAMHRMLSREM
jgi:Uma2 family endonuclease